MGWGGLLFATKEYIYEWEQYFVGFLYLLDIYFILVLEFMLFTQKKEFVVFNFLGANFLLQEWLPSWLSAYNTQRAWD